MIQKIVYVIYYNNVLKFLKYLLNFMSRFVYFRAKFQFVLIDIKHQERK